MIEYDQLIADLATWSAWVPFTTALEHAPRLPGVYLFRTADTGRPVYVGMAGERAGGERGRRLPQGVRGRLAVYSTGKGAVSGLGEAALDRALADPAFVEAARAAAEAGHPLRAKELARAAIDHHDLQVSWTTTVNADAAKVLELAVETALAGRGLWNKPRRHRATS